MRRGVLLLLAVVFLIPQLLASQQQSSDLSQLAAGAGMIFRGQVVAVQLEPSRAPDEIRATRVTLRVEDGFRGVARGQSITIRQWNAGVDEYRVGESLVLFLYAPSPRSGLTSPVGGRAGHRRIDQVPESALDGLRVSAAQVEPETPIKRTVPARRPVPRAKSLRARVEAEP